MATSKAAGGTAGPRTSTARMPAVQVTPLTLPNALPTYDRSHAQPITQEPEERDHRSDRVGSVGWAPLRERHHARHRAEARRQGLLLRRRRRQADLRPE